MHLYIYVRGIKQDVDYFIRDLEAQYYPHDYKINGQPYKGIVQMGVREYGGFYELVFPEASLQAVIATLTVGGRDPFASYDGIGIKGGMYALRKILKCEPVPEYDQTTQGTPTSKLKYPDIRIIPIGIRKDAFGVSPMYAPGTDKVVAEKEGEIL